VDDHIAPQRTALGAPGLEQGGGKRDAESQAAAGHPQQGGIELPDDVGREEPAQAGGGERCIGAAEPAARPVGVDVLELQAPDFNMAFHASGSMAAGSVESMKASHAAKNRRAAAHRRE